jgi:hypothetical protein
MDRHTGDIRTASFDFAEVHTHPDLEAKTCELSSERER